VLQHGLPQQLSERTLLWLATIHAHTAGRSPTTSMRRSILWQWTSSASGLVRSSCGSSQTPL
jgi:hypothetical protein